MTMIRNGLIGACGVGGGGSSSQLALSDGLACYTQSFSGITTTSFSHNLGTTDIAVEFQDATGNFLVPDNWTATNNNTVSVEFASPTQGKILVIGCIESGLAPITGGVTSIEGLSGVVDLDCPDGSVNISTSGQVINICALFTPASGAVLQQTQEDITILSGLIGTGGGGGVASINNISGVITLTSPDQTIEVTNAGQNIQLELAGRFYPVDARPASGSITPDTYCAYNLGERIARWAQVQACSGHVDRMLVGVESFSDPAVTLEASGEIRAINTAAGQTAQIRAVSANDAAFSCFYLSFVDGDRFALCATPEGQIQFLQKDTGGGGFNQAVTIQSGMQYVGIGPEATDPRCRLDVSGAICASGAEFLTRPTVSGLDVALLADLVDTQMTINGLSGQVVIDNETPGLEVSVSGQTILLSGLFTPASGAIIDQKCRDIEQLSGLILPDAGQTSINNISGQVTLTSTPGIEVIGSGQSIILSGLFTPASGAVLEQKCEDVLTLSGQVQNISGVLESTVSDAGQTSVNGLSGQVFIDNLTPGLGVVVSGQTILLSGLYTPASGAILDQKCADIDHLSGLILPDPGQTSVNGISGVVNLTSPDDSVNIAVNAQEIELTTPNSGAPSGASYLLANYNDNNHLTAARILSATSGVVLDDQGARSTSGIVVKLDFENEPINGYVLKWNGTRLQWFPDNGGGGGSGGVTSINGISGVISLASTNNGLTIGVNGQTIEFTSLFTYTSGQIIDQKCEDINTISGVANSATQKAEREFTSGSGLEFVLEHGLQTSAWVATMWRTDSTPEELLIPENIYPSGSNHAVVTFRSSDANPSGYTGRVVFVG